MFVALKSLCVQLKSDSSPSLKHRVLISVRLSVDVEQFSIDQDSLSEDIRLPILSKSVLSWSCYCQPGDKGEPEEVVHKSHVIEKGNLLCSKKLNSLLVWQEKSCLSTGSEIQVISSSVNATVALCSTTVDRLYGFIFLGVFILQYVMSTQTTVRSSHSSSRSQ